MTNLRCSVGPLAFVARLEEAAAPKTCAFFCSVLPFRNRLLQARWSGEAAWVPLGDFESGLETENATSRPAPGQLLFYPQGISETEILLPYGMTIFASKFGQLSGNHFATIIQGQEQLAELGRLVLWEGAQDIVFDLL
ncbi:MAG TPA: DUF3830 family protein [Roseiflexaceae bacterium]|nr:DUF3830 family protein [Roseiflexaceae bacterium]